MKKKYENLMFECVELIVDDDCMLQWKRNGKTWTGLFCIMRHNRVMGTRSISLVEIVFRHLHERETRHPKPVHPTTTSRQKDLESVIIKTLLYNSKV